jgi:pyruvate carboxylase
MRPISKLLVANRGEIAIRVFRTAHELGIRTVALYTHEDRYALHRFKADEAYLIGEPGEPIKSYLNIERIVALAKANGVDAIHPGYGFLSENAEFARRVREAGMIFVGPTVGALEQLGDKTAARRLAAEAKVPVLSGSPRALRDAAEGRKLAAKLGYPVILKASMGGGGRGMRVVHNEGELTQAFESAAREAANAFGCADIFVEKFIGRARHIEVQLLGDSHGHLLHLHERDCSVQRRHQKVVEIAPAFSLDPVLRREICDAAVRIGTRVHYECAGTVEFLVDADTGAYFFIEVNPRIQVEHTVTEEITGVDIVKAQILVAQGARLDDPEIGLARQEDVVINGCALQCRVTTEDPANHFMPDHGRISAYRSASGMGIRLDAGSAFSGAVVTPYYDSLLVKVSAWARNYRDAVRKMERALSEFRVRGVKTNIPFLQRLLQHDTFLRGECTTRFIDTTPELFQFPPRQDRATKLLGYLAETIVNGNALVAGRRKADRRAPAAVPAFDPTAPRPEGARDRWKRVGTEKFLAWIGSHKGLLLTDTSFRDAHQSLFATRMRTHDMLNVMEAYSRLTPQMFSLEMWGGATFDTAMRFLKEDPWERLARLREKAPNLLFQMLIRASSAVGYTNYPDNAVKAFVKEAAGAGMDIFRVFDALNWTPNLKVAMEAVARHGALCEACICYTGDILNPDRRKYDLKYYVKMAKELERMGAHILGIKDMAGLCKPEAARVLVKALKEEIGLPIHFHTHDTAGIQAASILNAAGVGLDIADAAMAPLSGGTSQPNLNTLSEALRFGPRATGLDTRALDALAEYWREVRQFYAPFDTESVPATADLYEHEMPGGQYTNLYQQAREVGLVDQWPRICAMYAEVNRLLGDIVKVTPTSKAVGDIALFMVANRLQPGDLVEGDRELAFPASALDLLGGRMGQPPGGWPKALQKRVLREQKPIKGRPGAVLPPVDFDAVRAKVKSLIGEEPTQAQVLSHVMYPKVFEEFAAHGLAYGNTSILSTPVFFYGLQPGEEMSVDIEQGKTLIIKFLTVSEPTDEGKRTVFFELNGQPREVVVADKSVKGVVHGRAKADPADPTQVGASMPGMVSSVAVKEGESVKKGQKLLVLEAMKMETTLYADREGVVKSILVKPGSAVESGDLLLVVN